MHKINEIVAFKIYIYIYVKCLCLYSSAISDGERNPPIPKCNINQCIAIHSAYRYTIILRRLLTIQTVPNCLHCIHTKVYIRVKNCFI